MHREFCIDHFGKDIVSNSCKYPQFRVTHFYLEEGPIGISNDENFPVSTGISRSRNFPALAIEILDYLKKPMSFNHKYGVHFTKKAVETLSATELSVIEEIIVLHNDFLTPHRLHLK